MVVTKTNLLERITVPGKRVEEPLCSSTLADVLEDAHSELVGAVETLYAITEVLAYAGPVKREQAEDALNRALECAATVSRCLKASEPVLPGRPFDRLESPETLQSKVEYFAQRLRSFDLPTARENLERIAAELERGRISEAVPRWKQSPWESKRVAARQEVEDTLSGNLADLPSLPGPREREASWLRWFWALDEGGQEIADVVARMEEAWTQLLDFLLTVRPEQWVDGGLDQSSAQDTMAETGALELSAEASSTVRSEAVRSEAGPRSGPRVPADGRIDAPANDGPDVTEEAKTEPLAAAPEGAEEASQAIAGAECGASGVSRQDPDEEFDLEVRTSTETQPKPSESARQPSEPPAEPSPVQARREPLPEFDFKAFARGHWVAADGCVGSAPWSESAFEEQLRKSFLQAALSDEWGRVALLGQALNQVAEERYPAKEHLELALDLRARHWPPPEDVQCSLANDLKLRLSRGDIQPTLRDRLHVALAFACPVATGVLAPDAMEELVVFADFGESAKAFFDAWGTGARRLERPFEQLGRQVNADNGVSVEELEHRRDEAGRRLRDELKRLHCAAGGRVQRTHCRKAWHEFMAEAKPVLLSALERPRDSGVRDEVAGLGEKAAKVFDRGGAARRDRAVMDRRVEELVELALRQFRLADAVDQAGDRDAERVVFPHQIVQCLESDSKGRPDDAWILGLFRHRALGALETPKRDLPKTLIQAHPWVLAAWPVESEPMESVDVATCRDPLLAAAHILLSEPVFDEGEEGDLRGWMQERAPELLRYVPSLTDRERSVLEARRQDGRDQLDDLIANLRRRQADLSDLAAADLGRVDDLIKCLGALANDSENDLRLLAAWARQVLGIIDEHVARTAQQVAAELVKTGHDEVAIRQMLKDERYADLHAVRGRDGNGKRRRVRVTEFRWRAKGRWSDSRRTLEALACRQQGPVEEFISLWLGHSRRTLSKLGDEQARELRELFLETVFEMTAEKRRTRIKQLKDSDRLDCRNVEEWLAGQARAPSFFPQLSRFSELCVKVPNLAVRDRDLPRRLPRLGEDNCITILLLPGLAADQREVCRERISQADPGRPIALIDDLDICRLLNLEGQLPPPIEALMEIVLEQQCWGDFGPYQVQEGQHVHMQMYVGRRREAEDLVKKTTFSRIFSGRRLGKTALLRHVQHTYDRQKLASGNTLRVLYVPIVGLGLEDAVVSEIIEKLRECTSERIEATGTARERLNTVVQQLLSNHPEESYLVFLDEADTFFENQTRVHASGGAGDETALSWGMRQLEAHRDKAGQPRIRFVVCGYRATNRSEGAWGNWGDVLLLNPLEVSDAVELVVGPLARMGIDARDQADAIAFRCGYQPALIIRFCARLLERLEKLTPLHERDRRDVLREDVVAVYQLPEIQDLVREICWLNFVGDPYGQLAFAAFLAESGDYPPGVAIDDAPRRLLDHIRNETSDAGGGPFAEGTWYDIASRHLRDLVKRSLLVEAEHKPLSLRLRFPHQMPVLLQDSPSSRIRDALHRLQVPPAERRRLGWLVPDDLLENARYAVGDEARELGSRYVVFGTHWPQPLLDERRGLPQRLPTERVHPSVAAPPMLESPPPGDQPLVLVGGADLLRAALNAGRESSAIECVRLGRLTSETVESFFKRIRGIEFSGAGGLAQIMEATSGIPMLVARLDEYLVREFREDATIDNEQLGKALVALGEVGDEIARLLLAGDEATRLEAGEIELLRLIVAGSRIDSDSLQEFLEDTGQFRDMAVESGVFGEHELDTLRGVGPGDNERLLLLLKLGLVPRRPDVVAARAIEEVAPVNDDDVLHRIVSSLAAKAAPSE